MQRLLPLQAIFLPQRNTSKQIAALRILIDDCGIYQRNISIISIDFKKAFDSISRSAIPRCLAYHGVPSILILAIMDLYDSTFAKARINNETNRLFETSSSVLQGDTLAPFPFVLILDAVLRDAMLVGYTVRCRRSSRHPEIWPPYLAFADDIAFLSDSPQDAQHAVNH